MSTPEPASPHSTRRALRAALATDRSPSSTARLPRQTHQGAQWTRPAHGPRCHVESPQRARATPNTARAARGSLVSGLSTDRASMVVASRGHLLVGVDAGKANQLMEDTRRHARRRAARERQPACSSRRQSTRFRLRVRAGLRPRRLGESMGSSGRRRSRRAASIGRTQSRKLEAGGIRPCRYESSRWVWALTSPGSTATRPSATSSPPSRACTETMRPSSIVTAPPPIGASEIGRIQSAEMRITV